MPGRSRLTASLRPVLRTGSLIRGLPFAAPAPVYNHGWPIFSQPDHRIGAENPQNIMKTASISYEYLS
ncbi:hypothetical protein C8024_10400 [Sphingopyxis sp. BSNA05]|nr:hypothetical protein [Sphingopyxis sp. BSNA05]